MNFFVYLNIFCFYDKKQKNISFDKVYCKYKIDIPSGIVLELYCKMDT